MIYTVAGIIDMKFRDRSLWQHFMTEKTKEFRVGKEVKFERLLLWVAGPTARKAMCVLMIYKNVQM